MGVVHQVGYVWVSGLPLACVVAFILYDGSVRKYQRLHGVDRRTAVRQLQAVADAAFWEAGIVMRDRSTLIVVWAVVAVLWPLSVVLGVWFFWPRRADR